MYNYFKKILCALKCFMIFKNDFFCDIEDFDVKCP